MRRKIFGRARSDGGGGEGTAAHGGDLLRGLEDGKGGLGALLVARDALLLGNRRACGQREPRLRTYPGRAALGASRLWRKHTLAGGGGRGGRGSKARLAMRPRG